MSDTKNKGSSEDASILDYYRKINNNDPARQAVGAAVDLVKNWMDMRTAGTLEADKYYHCKGNCEAAQRGEIGEYVSSVMSDVREYIQSRGGKKDAKDTFRDQTANQYGRNHASSQERCEETCKGFRPTWLDKKHW